MTNREFIIWLLGYLQLCPNDPLTRKKLFIIKNHLNLVRAVEGQFSDINACIWKALVEHLEIDAPVEQLLRLRGALNDLVSMATL
jgi:hypothetical protein